MQKEAQIEQMVRDGLPLGAVAAALASPETAERIALMEVGIHIRSITRFCTPLNMVATTSSA